MDENEKIRVLRGGNMDIDLIPNPKVSWSIDPCPWNLRDGVLEHKCAVKIPLSAGISEGLSQLIMFYVLSLRPSGFFSLIIP